MALWNRLVGETKTARPGELADATARSLAAGARAGLGTAVALSQDNVEQVIEGHYKRVLWVFRCVDAIAQAECSLPIYAWKSHDDDAARVDGWDHIEGLLNGPDKPNKLEEYWEFRYRISTLLLLSQVGVFIEVVRDPVTNDPAQLTILDSDAVEIIPDAADGVKAFRVRYAAPVGPHGQTIIKQKELDPDRVLWLRSRPHPKDPYKQVTPLQAAGLSADTDFLARLFNRNWLSNDGRVAQLIAVKAETQGGLNPDDADKVKAMFGGGVQRAGETRVVEADQVSVAQVGGTPADAQYTDLLQGSKQDIMMAFGLSESFLAWAAGKCVDDETEALTQRGWLRGDQITTDDTILSMDPEDGVLKWSPVHEVYRAPYSGEMYRLKHRSADFLVTPGHNWAIHPRIERAGGPRFNLCKVEDLKGTDRIQTMGEAETSNVEPTYSNAFVELVGWSVTEGWYFPNEESRARIPRSTAPAVRIRQKDGASARRIQACIKEAGARSRDAMDHDRPMWRFEVRGETAAAIQAVAPEKIMTRDFLLALTADQRHLLLNTMIDADGCRQGSTSSWTFAQKSKDAAEAFVLLATLCGYTTSMRRRSFKYRYKGVTSTVQDWLVIVRTTKVMTIQRQTRQVEYYAGTVWCPRTDFGTFVARRNGRVVVTGNTFDNSDNEIEVVWQNTMRWHCKAVATGFMPLLRAERQGQPGLLAHDFSRVPQLQRANRLKADKALAEFQAGLISADEYREATGKDPWKVAGTKVIWTPGGPVGPDDKTTKAAQEMVATNRPPTPPLAPGADPTTAGGALPGAQAQPRALPAPAGSGGAGSTGPGQQRVASQADLDALRGKLRSVVNERAAENSRTSGRAALAGAKAALASSPERKTAVARPRSPRRARPRRSDVIDGEVVGEQVHHDEHPSEARTKTLVDDLHRTLGGVTRRMLGAIDGRLQSTKTRRGTRHWTPASGAAEVKVEHQLREWHIAQVDRWGDEVAAHAGFLIRGAASGAMADMRAVLNLDAGQIMLASRLVRDMTNRLTDDLRAGIRRRVRSIETMIRRMDDAGASIDDIKRAVAEQQQVLDDWVAQVAPRVARAAVQGARKHLIDRVPDSVGVSVWKSVDDEKVRPEHVAADGQVAQRGHGFRVGGYRMMFPGDPRVPPHLWANCRCYLAYRTADGTEH